MTQIYSEHARSGAPNGGCVREHPTEGRGMPADRSATGDDTRLLHPAADLLQADPVQPNPGKDQPDNAGFFRHYLKARHTPAKGLGHVATAIGAGDEGADHSPPARNGSAQTHGTTWRISTIQNSIDTGASNSRYGFHMPHFQCDTFKNKQR